MLQSNVAYPDAGINPLGGPVPIAYSRWVRGRAYSVGDFVVHYGSVWMAIDAVPATPANTYVEQMPPGVQENFLTWARQTVPVAFDANTDYVEGTLVHFPAVTYETRFSETDPALSLEQRFTLVSTPTFTPAGYPSGMWRRNATPDDGESLLPKYPTLASKYWDVMEPPMFQLFPEIPQGELTTFGGRVWRKRTPVMAAYEAPPSAPLDWALQKTSNRFAMFDASVQSQTKQTKGSNQYPPVAADDQVISVVLTPGASIVDAAAFLNLTATSVRVKVEAGSPLATVYDRTTDLVTSPAVTNWYEWFYSARYVGQSLVLDDLPPVIDSTITITITNTGGQAACGVCIIGKQTYIGDAQFGAAIGLKDYSLKTTDDFGNVATKQRAYSDRLTVPILLHNDVLDSIKRLLTKYRTVPVLWVGSPGIPSTIVYGYYKDFSAVIAYPKESTCNLEIEGLT